jgi:TolB-like protein
MLFREYGLEPSEETRALAEAVRSGSEAAAGSASPTAPAVERAREAPFAPAPIRSLAAVPLDNLSRDPQKDYFADGRTDALITELGKVRALRVISRQSVMPFRSSPQSLPGIARALEVEAVVEGSVLQEKGRIRITAQLIRCDPQTASLGGELRRSDWR